MTDNYITASCKITSNTVYKNSEQFYVSIEPADFFVSLYKSLNIDYPRFYKMDNLSKLGWLTSEILLKDSFEKTNYQPEETGLLLFNANASLDTDVKYLETVKEIASPSVFVYTLPNIMIGEICIRNHFKGETAFFITEKPDAVFMHQYVNDLLNKNILQACICGWVELVGDEYKSVLFLVEKKQTGTAQFFSVDTINQIFGTDE